MLFCLSSSATPRYRQDILRALAMPADGRLQFRYSLKIVAVGLHDRIEKNKLVGTDVCIAYVDTVNPAVTPDIAPVRAAKVAFSAVEGDFCILELRLVGFAFAQDLPAFNRQIRAQCGNLPHWSSGSLIGNFCEEIAQNGLPINLNANPGQWQQVCTSLTAYTPYQNERMFYRLEGLYSVSTGERVDNDGKKFLLQSGELYDVRWVHYSPTRLRFPAIPTNADFDWLVADADDKVVTFVGTRSLAVDSDYDRKSARFRASSTTAELDARFSFSRKLLEATKPEEATWDFDLHCLIEPDRWKQIKYGLLIGLPVAIQGFVLTVSNEKIAHPTWVAIAVVISGFATGLLATFFGPRKT